MVHKKTIYAIRIFGPRPAVGYDWEGFEKSERYFRFSKKGRNIKLLPFAGRAVLSRRDGMPNIVPSRYVSRRYPEG
jgi:hypothetical protein